MYNFNHLYYFYITAKAGNVTTAAKHLSISQPSLSAQLKVLEDFLQIKLFQKVGRINKLTTQGELIFSFCKRMFEASEEMNVSLTEQAPFQSRRLHVGVSSEIANSFVVEVISHFLSHFKNNERPKVIMVSCSHEKLLDKLVLREIDVLVSPESTTFPELENLQALEVPVNLICSFEDRCMLENNELDIAKALEFISKESYQQWVLPSTGTKLRSEINQFFEEHKIKGRIVFESDVIESITRSVVDKIAIAFMPLIYVPKELTFQSIYSLGPIEGFWKHKIWLACHIKDKDDRTILELSKSFKEFCDSIKNCKSSI